VCTTVVVRAAEGLWAPAGSTVLEDRGRGTPRRTKQLVGEARARLVGLFERARFARQAQRRKSEVQNFGVSKINIQITIRRHPVRRDRAVIRAVCR